MDHNNDIIYEIISALAAADGVEPSNLDYEFSEYINPVALGNLFAKEGEFWECSFDVPKHEVTVTHTGEVFVDGSRRRQIGDDTVGDAVVRGQVQDTLRYRQSTLKQVPCMLYRCENQESRPMEFVNNGCKDVTGYDPNALLIGGVSYGIDIMHSADRDRIRESVKNALNNGDEYSVCYRIDTAENEEKEVWDKGVGVAGDDSDSSLVGFVMESPPSTNWSPD